MIDDLITRGHRFHWHKENRGGKNKEKPNKKQCILPVLFGRGLLSNLIFGSVVFVAGIYV